MKDNPRKNRRERSKRNQINNRRCKRNKLTELGGARSCIACFFVSITCATGKVCDNGNIATTSGLTVKIAGSGCTPSGKTLATVMHGEETGSTVGSAQQQSDDGIHPVQACPFKRN